MCMNLCALLLLLYRDNQPPHESSEIDLFDTAGRNRMDTIADSAPGVSCKAYTDVGESE